MGLYAPVVRHCDGGPDVGVVQGRTGAGRRDRAAPRRVRNAAENAAEREEPFRPGLRNGPAVHDHRRVRRTAVADGFDIAVTSVRQGDSVRQRNYGVHGRAAEPPLISSMQPSLGPSFSRPSPHPTLGSVNLTDVTTAEIYVQQTTRGRLPSTSKVRVSRYSIGHRSLYS